MSGDDGGGGGLRSRVRAALDRLIGASAAERIGLSIAALVASILVGAVIVLLSGWVATCGSPFLTVPGLGTFCYDPFTVYWVLFKGAFGSTFNLALTLKETTLLVFAGLSVAVAFRAGMFNIGTQGQLVLGGLGTAIVVLGVAPYVPGGVVGGLIIVPLGLLVGAVVGGAYGAIPGALKAYADANEVITTIMLNFVATGVAFVLVAEYFKDPASQSIETSSLPGFATLQPLLFSGSTFSIWALALGIALVVGIYKLLGDTSFGYDLRTSGVQPEAADYGGVDAQRTMVASMALSGALAGVGGAVWVMMVMARWRTGVPGLGFDGITVSILASNNPLGVLPAALLFGTLKSGSLALEFAPNVNVPRELVGVLRGLVILFVAMPAFFRMLAIRWGFGEDRTVAADGGVDDE